MLFLHGYLSNGRSFYNQLKFFERDFNVLCPDLKGFGENGGMDYPYALEDYLEDVKEFIYKSNTTQPHVVAHSFGARIAVKGASEEKELFDKLVLTGAAGLKPKTTLKKRMKKISFGLLKRFVDGEKLQNFYSDDYRRLSPVMKESFKKIVNEHLDDRLKSVENPTLLIFGKNDEETPLYMAERLRRGIKNSALSVYDGAGHFCFIDKPIKFNAEVREFLLS